MIVYAIKNKKGKYYNCNANLKKNWFRELCNGVFYKDFESANETIKQYNCISEFQNCRVVKVEIKEVEEV